VKAGIFLPLCFFFVLGCSKAQEPPVDRQAETAEAVLFSIEDEVPSVSEPKTEETISPAAPELDSLESGDTAVSAKKEEPPWYHEVPPATVYWGIGNAKQSNDALSRTMSEARAQKNIAEQLDADAKKEAGYTMDAGNRIIHMRIEGMRTIQRWRASDGAWWCLVEYNKSDAEKLIAGEFSE
jgi:hypothetical protein